LKANVVAGLIDAVKAAEAPEKSIYLPSPKREREKK
jgi:hypothetical protein